MNHELIEAVETVARMADASRRDYADTQQYTRRPFGSCMTIRVPVAMLNRVREAAEHAKKQKPVMPQVLAMLKLAHEEIARLSETTPSDRRVKSGENNTICISLRATIKHLENAS